MSGTVLQQDAVAKRRALGSGPSVGSLLHRKGARPECPTRQLQLRPESQPEPTAVPSLVHEVLRSPGQPLDVVTRAFMEPRFGHDFSGVRVHADSEAAKSAMSVNALAYTAGRHIVFDVGQHAPETSRGRALMAHELTHVVQQSRVSAKTPPILVAKNDGHEQTAKGTAWRVACGEASGTVEKAASPMVQRTERTGNSPDQPAVSLGFLDSRITGAMASSLVGGTTWRLLREALRGVVEGVRGQTDERKQRVVARFLELSHDLEGQWDYFKGCSMGIGLGLWDSVKGILDLLTLGLRVQWQAISWLLAHGEGMVRNFGQIRAEAHELSERLAEVRTQFSVALQEFIASPREGIQALRAMLDRLVEQSQAMARQAGRTLAAKIFNFLELPWRKFGESVGYAVGVVLFEVLLAVATEGIGTALKAIGSAVAKGGRLLASEALRVFRWLGEITGKLWGVVKSCGRVALKIFGGLFESLGRLVERVQTLIRRVVGGMEATAEAMLSERTLAGGGRVPPGSGPGLRATPYGRIGTGPAAHGPGAAAAPQRARSGERLTEQEVRNMEGLAPRTETPTSGAAGTSASAASPTAARVTTQAARTIDRLALDTIPNITAAERSVLSRVGEDTWTRLLDYARIHRRDLRSVKGKIAEELFTFAPEFSNTMQRAMARAASENIPSSAIQFVRDIRGLAPTRTSRGAFQELADGAIVAIQGDRVRILTVFESKSPGTLRGLVRHEGEFLGQLGGDFERFRQVPIMINGRVFQPRQVVVSRVATDWLGVAPPGFPLTEQGTKAIRGGLSGFQLFHGLVRDDVLNAIAARLAWLLP